MQGFKLGLLAASCLLAFDAAAHDDEVRWEWIAKETGTFRLTEESAVRYGIDQRWTYRTFGKGRWKCSNEVFGRDPSYGITKLCQKRVVTPTPIPVPTPTPVPVPTPTPVPVPTPTPVPPPVEPPPTPGACSTTLSPGANVAAAISGASAGATICLNSGNYGTLDITNAIKSADVTVRSVSGRGATLALRIYQSNHLRFQNLTIGGLEIDTNQDGGTKNVSIAGNTFTGQTVINTGNNGNANIVIDGNTFDGISVCSNCYEGRVQIIANPWSSQPSGVTISNNHFGNGGESDGIQNGANGVKIGPGNVFDGILQGSYGRHVDAIQLYGQSNTTITGNYFRNGDVFIMAPDGGENEVITDNVFSGSGYYWKVQLGSHDNGKFQHNTVVGAMGISIDAKTDREPSTGAVVRDNLMAGSMFKTTDSNGRQACSGCTFSSNQFKANGDALGTSNVIGAPTFVGGAAPTTWAGFKLAPVSTGYKAASDGADFGANYFGP